MVYFKKLVLTQKCSVIIVLYPVSILFLKLFDEFKSRFRSHHNTETAMVKVSNDVRTSDRGPIPFLLMKLNKITLNIFQQVKMLQQVF